MSLYEEVIFGKGEQILATDNADDTYSERIFNSEFLAELIRVIRVYPWLSSLPHF
jgi:hypothetical protein